MTSLPPRPSASTTPTGRLREITVGLEHLPNDILGIMSVKIVPLYLASLRKHDK